MPVAVQQILQARPNEWIGVLCQGISVLGALAGLRVSGDAAIGLANSVGSASTRGYANAQAPQANVSTVTTTDASNRSTTTGAVTTDASNRSTTMGAVTTTSSVSATTDSSTHSTPTSTITRSYNPASTTTTNPAAEMAQ